MSIAKKICTGNKISKKRTNKTRRKRQIIFSHLFQCKEIKVENKKVKQQKTSPNKRKRSLTNTLKGGKEDGCRGLIHVYFLKTWSFTSVAFLSDLSSFLASCVLCITCTLTV